MSACATEDPLDPGLLERIARRVGDANGTALSGVYPMPATTPARCDCAELDVSVLEFLFDAAPDTATCSNLAAWIFLKQIRLEVKQYDGFMLGTDDVPGGILLFSDARLRLSGPVDSNESAELASVINLSGDELQLRARANLTFEAKEGAPTAASGFLRSRVISRVPGGKIDCRIDFDLEGVAEIEETGP
jgi:hypothetical protein